MRETDTSGQRWEALMPAQAAQLFTSARFPWWISGGWALDLFLGHQSREHGDLDIAVLRRDQDRAAQLFSDWDLRVAARGRLRSLRPGEWLELGENDLWCRPTPSAPWVFQLVLTEGDQQRWVYRRDRRITRPLAEIGLRTREGIPYLAPELVLLFKATHPLAKDESDFANTIPHLNDAARHWLAGALTVTHPRHPWLTRFS